jgi:hypothetical protein
MYKRIYSSILNRQIATGKIFIRNKELPICSNCLHFIEHKNNNLYQSIPHYEQYNKCEKFGEVNLITGAMEYDSARNCRLDVNKCGNLGSEYRRKDTIS